MPLFVALLEFDDDDEAEATTTSNKKKCCDADFLRELNINAIAAATNSPLVEALNRARFLAEMLLVDNEEEA